MAAPDACAIFSTTFPDIDTDISSYINGILEDGCSDFETCDDLFDAIGLLLHQSCDDKTEDDVREICERMYDILSGTESSNYVDHGSHKALTAPIQLSSLAVAGDRKEKKEQQASIWLTRRDNATQVDQKKLGKAEEKIKQKIERRSAKDAGPKTVENGNFDNATASQQINRREAKMDASGSNKTYDIRIENFDVAFGERTLISGADMQLTFGHRYGFVGRNGLGKTTLLRMLANGQLLIPSHITLLHVEQEVLGDDTVALQSVLECDEKRESLLREEREISVKITGGSEGTNSNLSSRLNEIYHKLDDMDADRAPARASVILAGLGFSPKMQKMPTREFSGGWRMRLALARALFAKPDLLLLDEPTNMLDMKAIIWLETYLQTWVTTILVVSHDRHFLNAVSTDILHLHSQRLDNYKGDYEIFHKTREERLKNQKKEYEAQKQYRDHIQVFIDRFRYNANRAAQVQSKLKLLEKLPEIKPLHKESEVIIRFPETEKLSPPILQLDELEFYYAKDKPIFSSIIVNANMESRICIVGENGAGKTTLLKLLLGDLEPTSGVRHAHRNLRLGYFSQHHVDQLDMDVCSLELLANRFPGKGMDIYRAQLGSFGVTGELATRPVSSLSGGQKSRLAFSAMSMSNPNFFVLDEPTNHLDMQTIEALGRALNKFTGGVILVSHDERLIRMVCKELWVVGNGKVVSLEGGFDEYKTIVQEELAAQS